MRADLRTAVVGLVGAAIGGVCAMGGRRGHRADGGEPGAGPARGGRTGRGEAVADEYRTVGLYLERSLQNGVWESVSADARIRISDADRPYLSPLSRIEAKLMRLTLTEITEGREALRPLSGESPAVTPAPPLRRPQPPIVP